MGFRSFLALNWKFLEKTLNPVVWKEVKHQANTGCGMCPDIEIEGWETAY